jgi:hypothetical protein
MLGRHNITLLFKHMNEKSNNTLLYDIPAEHSNEVFSLMRPLISFAIIPPIASRKSAFSISSALESIAQDSNHDRIACAEP